MEIKLIRDNITKYRKIKGKTGTQMSNELGKSDFYIKNIECGYSSPSLKELLKISEYLEISPAKLFEDDKKSI